MNIDIYYGEQKEYKYIKDLGGIKSHSVLVKCVKTDKQFCLKKYQIAELKDSSNFYIQDRLQNQPKHPMLLHIKSYFKNAVDVFQVWEFCEGLDIKTNCQKIDNLNQKQLQILILNVIKQLNCIHSLGYIYFVLTPQTIVQKIFAREKEEQYTYKLCNFHNLIRIDAKFKENDFKNLTSRTDRFAYQAPEVLKGRIDLIDFALDIWSLGVIIIELLTKKQLFIGKKSNDINQQQEKIKADSQVLENLIPNKELLKFLMQMISLDPKQRPTLNQVNEFFDQYFFQEKIKRNKSLKIEISGTQYSIVQIENMLQENARLQIENNAPKANDVTKTQSISNTAPLLGNVQQNKDGYSQCELCKIINIRSQLKTQQLNNQLQIDSNLQQTTKYKKNALIVSESNELIQKIQQEIQIFIEQKELGV